MLRSRSHPNVVRYEWSDVVNRDLFGQLLLSGAAVPVGYLLISSSGQPGWLMLSPLVAALCYVCAFVRLWRTSQEEAAISDWWRTLEHRLTPRERHLDAVFEVPYLLALMVMPFFAVAYQLFAPVLVLFYAAHAACNRIFISAFLRVQEGDAHQAAFPSCAVSRYMINRQRVSALCGAVFLVSGTAVWEFAVRSPDLAVTVATVSVTLVALVEWLYEPYISRDLHNDEHVTEQVQLIEVPDELPEPLRSQLEALHTEAFPIEERHVSMDDMLSSTGCEGLYLRFIYINDRLVGYVFYQVDAAEEIAYLWYLAVESSCRGRGIGSQAIRYLLQDLETSSVPIRYAILEAHSPLTECPTWHRDRRRISLYRALGAYWLRGLRYAIVSNSDPNSVIHYEIMLFPVIAEITTEGAKEAATALARRTIGESGELWPEFLRTLDGCIIQSPSLPV